MKKFLWKNMYLIILVVGLVMIFINRPAIVSGVSMYPTLKNNQFIIFNTLQDYKVGDIVVVDSSSFLPEKYIVKRIIDISDEGVFLQGDNTEFSYDSRNFGYIPKDCILGVVHTI